MNQPSVSVIKLSACLSILFIYFLSLPVHAQKPGAHYFADADGNGVIEVPDMIVLNTVLGDFSADDTLLYSGYPQSRYRQDLDGNGVIEVPDLIILNNWIPGDFSSNPGAPDKLALDGDTHLNLNLGDSVTLRAYALSPIAAGSQVRTGFGVIFKIDPSSTCTTAQIRGYDVAGGATINAWRNPAAYHYTLQPGAPDNGRASVRINTSGCNPGQTIKVEFYIPDDTEAGVAPGRFPSKLPASQKFSISVKPIHDYWVANTILRTLPLTSEYHTAVWTGTEMLVWRYESTGYRYNPITDEWSPISTNNAPSPREYFSAVWTGTEMIIYGGGYPMGMYWYPNSDGGRYNPATDSWTPISYIWGRAFHSAVWTGTEMIVWGGNYWKDGNPLNPIYRNDGARYNPSTNYWTDLPISNTPSARASHTAVWTGTEMIVWGGWGGSYLNTGGRYDPQADSWAGCSTTDAPSPRTALTAVWTGTEMVVWGGSNGSTLATGGRYNPATDTWTPTSSSPVAPRASHTAVWTGTEMIVWGGDGSTPTYKNDGGRYVPGTDSWVATTTNGAPERRHYHNAVWTGTEMIIWGGSNSSHKLNTGGRYDPESDSWGRAGFNTPEARSDCSAVWAGSEMIIWGGYPYINTGGRFDPVTDSWAATSTINASSGRYLHSTVWTGSEMIIWGGYPITNTGGRYDPSTDSWSGTSTINAPSQRDAHAAVWTGSKMIVWGGNNGSSYLNNGGNYDPISDTWLAISTTNAPSQRGYHTAVWTGTEMIVWGGKESSSSFLNSGGKYDPASDSWTATSTGANVPTARSDHTAVWTGTKMIVWGGYGSTPAYKNDGGIYIPGTDSWTATSTGDNVPSARYSHTVVWTGTEMIVWGGEGSSSSTNSGGWYDPDTDSWVATPTENCPSARYSHAAVWTGRMMIIWGGNPVSVLNDGGIYVP